MSSSLRAALVLVLFVAGLVGGAAAYRVVNAVPEPPAYPPLPPAAEPAAARGVATALATDDADALTKLEAELLADLQSAVEPLSQIDEVTYAGAVRQGEDTLAGYLAEGSDAMGERALVGFVLRVRGDAVVGVN